MRAKSQPLIDTSVHICHNQATMSDTQTISATQARNNFFQILDQALLENKIFIIKKGKIPIAQISPPQVQSEKTKDEKHLELFKKIDKFRNTLPFQKQNSVDVIREMREERMKKSGL